MCVVETTTTPCDTVGREALFIHVLSAHDACCIDRARDLSSRGCQVFVIITDRSVDQRAQLLVVLRINTYKLLLRSPQQHRG